MSGINNISPSGSPLFHGMTEAFRNFPLPLDEETGELSIAGAYEWINHILMMRYHDSAPQLGFDPSLIYPEEHLDALSQLLHKMSLSKEFQKSGEIPMEYVRTWQELQGKVLIEALAPEIERVAGDVLANVHNTRTRIGDILEKPGLSNYAKAGIAAGSFGIMGLFQYRFLESLFHVIAQYDINEGKSGAMVQLVQNQGAMLGTGIGWSVLSACAFAYLVKTGFETHLSDKLMGTKRTMKKSLCALGCAALLGIEMTGSFSRITIGTDLKSQVVGMKSGLETATTGDTTVFKKLADEALGASDLYTGEGKALFQAEAARGGVGPYAAAKQAAYVPRSQIDWAKIDRVPGLRQKVEALYVSLEAHRSSMKTIQERHGIEIKASAKETSAPVVLDATAYHVGLVAKQLSTVATSSVDELLESHNLIDPSFSDVVADLVFDAGKKLHPQDVNTLRAALDKQIVESGENVDALTEEMSRTIDTIDAFMRDMTTSANIAYKSEATYTPKPKPGKIDTSGLKKALESTKVPVSVLNPLGVWSKFIDLSSDGTIPFSYSLALLLRVLLVEGILLGIGYSRIRQTNKALSTPGARFEDLARETDGQYLKIVAMIEKLTGGEAWQLLNGKALNREEIHTLLTTILAKEPGQGRLGNHMSVVDENGKSMSSTTQKWKELLGAAFFGQYSAPEIRRLRDLDGSLVYWKNDITGDGPTPNTPWLQGLRELISVKPKPVKAGGDAEEGYRSMFELPEVAVKTGNHHVFSSVSTILAGTNPLKGVSDTTQRRISNESTRQKSREWSNVHVGISTFLQENPHLSDLVSRIRGDDSHPLARQIQTLDEIGDIFGYYKRETADIEARVRFLMRGRNEKVIFGARDTLLRETINALKQKLLKLKVAGVLDQNDKQEVKRYLGLENASLLEPGIHGQVVEIFARYSDNAYVQAHILSEKNWAQKKEFSPIELEKALQVIEGETVELRTLQARRKKIERFIAITGETATELEIITLRNAAAEIKKHLPTSQ